MTTARFNEQNYLRTATIINLEDLKQRDISISAAEKAIQGEKENLLASIERMKAEIIAAEDKIKGPCWERLKIKLK